MEKHLQIDIDNTVGNTIEVVARDDYCSIAVEHPWHGDSETGFGATLSDRLSPSQAHAMGSLLIQWAKSCGFEAP